MSSWIVSDNCINSFLTFLKNRDLNNMCNNRNDYFKILKIDNCLYLSRDLERLGRKMLKMNIEATEQRYTKPYLNKKEKATRIKAFRFKEFKALDVQVYKNLMCYLYQCAEGDIDKRKLYKQLRKIEDSLPSYIIRKSKEFDKANWGTD